MEMILQQFLNFEIMRKVWPLLLRGLGTTLYLCALVIPLGLDRRPGDGACCRCRSGAP